MKFRFGNHKETHKVLTIIPLKLRFYAGMQSATKPLPSSPKDPKHIHMQYFTFKDF